MSAPVTIDWWEVERTVQCDASLSFLYVGDGNDETNDRSQGVELGEETVQSWSPDLSIAFVACVVAALLSFVFVRLSSQSEKWQLGGVYAGVIAFGFAFHLFQGSVLRPRHPRLECPVDLAHDVEEQRRVQTHSRRLSACQKGDFHGVF